VVWLRTEALADPALLVDGGGAGKLSAWPNSAQGLRAFDAHPSTATTRLPALAVGVANGWDAVHFRSPVAPHPVGSAFTIPFDLSAASTWSIFVVARTLPSATSASLSSPPTAVSSSRVLGASNTLLAVGFAGSFQDTLIDAAGHAMLLAGNANATVPAAGSDWKLYEYIVSSEGSQALFSGGVLIGVGAGGGAVKPRDLQLGGSLESYVAELLVFTDHVSTGLRQQVEAYLCSRYAIPLPLTHPYNATGLRTGSAPSGGAAASAGPASPDALPGLHVCGVA
jgi:hypothetical protein